MKAPSQNENTEAPPMLLLLLLLLPLKTDLGHRGGLCETDGRWGLVAWSPDWPLRDFKSDNVQGLDFENVPLKSQRALSPITGLFTCVSS